MSSSALLLFNRHRLIRQLALWRTELPHVVPHYAVKANNDSQLLRWLATAGARFDCASVREMHDVIQVGAAPTDIIYAQPCKKTADVATAQHMGIPNTVVDSVEEVEKLAAGGWRGGVLIRLMVPDAGSAQPFSRKFGAPIQWVPDILAALKEAGQRHVGWSFHVGSECKQAAQFRVAIELCADAATAKHANTEIVDVGGGFLPDHDAFREAAAAIRGTQHLFPSATKWIGEPGRFLSAPVADAIVEVIGRKPNITGGWRYTIDESVYGLFSNIPFDGFKPAFEVLSGACGPEAPATVFGRTCDSADCLATDIQLPTLDVGARLRVRGMGAYTIVSASEFNGFPQAQRIYSENEIH